MPTEPKLTKKQKKGVAFRERKGKGKAAPEEPADLPELEVQDEQESRIDAPASERDKLCELAVPERKSESRKRKRTETGDGDHPPDGARPAPAQRVSGKKAKKRKPDQSTKLKGAEAADATEEDINAKAKKFILFVGNLPYTITKSQIQEHFSECKPPPSIRLLTSRPHGGKPQTVAQAAKSKGCAFLEFTSHSAMQLAIRKHHSELSGRCINVELTAGGGGNSDQRKEKLRVRNRTLDEQRKKSADRIISASQASASAPQTQSRMPTRHSTTSGATEQPTQPKTWSIPTGEDGVTKPKKLRGKSKGGKAVQKASWTPSGANAIAVG